LSARVIDHRALIQHIGDIERQLHILLDQQNRGFLRFHGAKQFEHFVNRHRHDPFGRRIEHD
jgi:hypothetical protein